LPHIRLHPIAEPRIHADPAAERGQQIAPRTARARNPEHRLDKQPVVFAATPGVAGLPKTMRLHLRPLGVTQNESVHLKLESQPDSDVNPESKQTLVLQLRLKFILSLVVGVGGDGLMLSSPV